MHDDDNTDTSAPTRTACEAIRITPHEGGMPDHDAALTYHFAEPVTLLHALRNYEPAFRARPSDRMRSYVAPSLVGITAPHEHPQHADIAALAQGLWQRRNTYVSVDCWSRAAGGFWAYMLVPLWRHLDREDWPLPDERGVHLHAAGHAHAAQAPYPWPEPPPVPGRYDTGFGSHLFLATDVEAPPPPGAPTRARTEEVSL
ncbi:hypothetical protein [Streptomyces sulphureus]|uniref:hypothetical protein n=1 Tax=Streptomyces sulphureus TaxID=47758 RepID=UPI00037F8541|nr:hypothetical protein [Streptomyces sulphureus]